MKKRLIKFWLAPILIGATVLVAACKATNTTNEKPTEQPKESPIDQSNTNPQPNEIDSTQTDDTQHDSPSTDQTKPIDDHQTDSNSSAKQEEHVDSTDNTNPKNNDTNTHTNDQTETPHNEDLTSNEDQVLKSTQNKFLEIKNKMRQFNAKKLQMPYFVFFSKNNMMDGENQNQGSWLDDMQALIDDLKVITKENYQSDSFHQLVSIFDRIEKQFDEQEARESAPTITFETKPTPQEAHTELLRAITSLKKQHFFTEKYDTNEKAINIQAFYDDYTNLIAHQYYKYPYLSIGSTATVMFKDVNDNLMSFSATNNQLNDQAKQAMITYVKNALDLLEEHMSVYEKVFVLTRYVTDQLNYMNNSNGLNDAYLRHAGVCKEYVEQAALLYSMANLDFRIITGEQHTFFAFKNQDNQWFITDPTHLDQRPIDVDYPIVYQGNAQLIAQMSEMFKNQRHITWDPLINGLDSQKYLSDINQSNMIDEQTSAHSFVKQIDPQTESNYHYYNHKFYLIKDHILASFKAANKNETLSALVNQTFNDQFTKTIADVKFANLMAGYKNHLYVIGTKNQQTQIYDINLDDYSVNVLNTLISNEAEDLTYSFTNDEIILHINNAQTIKINKPNDYQFNDDVYNLNKRLKLAFLVFGLYYDPTTQQGAELLVKLNYIEQLIADENANLRVIKQSLEDIEAQLQSTRA
ncbi:hypothetical protein OF375_02930 [Ureaplasma miroungigenitalium]|uniref:hypothetical protein n=1 Tax=Ureaplasma miroungigenitalium TaxID=1042321 RepID=UPI0021E7110F|nr:hypothetical protein [Ureaplasma miroungigenitalium]MCV3734519.1 hypothetical protein [Ureaplasma miroungigenitalium]